MSQRTNEADIVAVTEVVRAYYDGMMEGDAAISFAERATTP